MVATEGVVFYLVTSTALVTFQYFQTTKSIRPIRSMKDLDGFSFQTPPRISNISRCDSDFSLGLGRSESVQKELSEIGPMCSGGKIAIQVVKGLLLLSLVTVCVVGRLVRK